MNVVRATLAAAAMCLAATASAQSGEDLIKKDGCTACHVPSLMTGDSPVVAFRHRAVNLYSDLLLHDMGDQLADGIVMQSASGRQWPAGHGFNGEG